MTVFPTVYAPPGVFVVSEDQFPLWQLENWLYRFSDYPAKVPNTWIQIQGETPCRFHPHKFAKYLEAISCSAQTIHPSGPLRHPYTGTSSAVKVDTFPTTSGQVYAI